MLSIRNRFIISFASIFLLASQMSFAQSEDNGANNVDFSNKVLFEVVPHTGYMGSSGIFGLKFGMNYSAIAFELAAEQVIGESSNLYPISLNLILNLTTKGKLIPFGLVGPALYLTVPTNTIGDETVTTAGLNFGGGVRYYFTSKFGARFEVKQYFTTVENQSENRDEVLIFQEISLGVSFLFK